MKKTILFMIMIASVLFAEQISIEAIATYDEKAMAFRMMDSYEVKEGDVLVIPAGIKLYFAPLVGITVKGELLINGRADRQVFLMSRRAAQGVGAPHDWAGIRLFQGAAASISYAVISNASFGVRSCCDNVTLLNTVFHSNGVNFQVSDRQIFVIDREPVSYERIKTKLNIESNPAKVDYDAIAGKNYYFPKRTWVLGPTAMALITGGVIHTVKWVNRVNDYNEFERGDMKFSEFEIEKKKIKDNASMNMWLGLSLSVAGLGLGTYATIFTIKY